MFYLSAFLFFVFLANPSIEKQSIIEDNPILEIQIDNIKEDKGKIEIGVFNTGERFLEADQAYKNYSIEVKNKKAVVVIDDLPPGNYAISLYHDENDDDKCNRNFVGIPKEPYAFSNNVKPRFSPPSYSDCVFRLEKDTQMNISLIH